jgi:hypothetical protein
LHKPTISQVFSSSFIIIVLAFLVVLFEVLDVTAGGSGAVNFDDRISFGHRIFYSTMTIISVFIQLYFLKTSSRIVFKTKKVNSRSTLLIVYSYIVSQLAVIILLVFLVGEQLVASTYHVVLVQLIVGISLVISVLIMVSLAIKCFKSYLSRKSKMAGFYAIAIISLSLQLISAFFYVEANLENKPQYISPERNPWASFYYTALNSKLFSLYDITKSISFFAVWILSLLLTKSYVQKIGKIKYWVIVSIPMGYFLFQYSNLLLNETGMLSSLLMPSGSIFPILYNFVLNTVNVGTAILFGISFFIFSRRLTYEHLKYYLIICGAGIMIIFSSSVSTILILAAFPAWGVVSISFILPASFLILMGLDSVTFYVAGDVRVRSYLSRSKSQFELFGALASTKASAEAERRIQEIIRQVHENIETESIFTPKSESEDIKQYVGEVIAELKKTTTKSGSFSDKPTT